MTCPLLQPRDGVHCDRQEQVAVRLIERRMKELLAQFEQRSDATIQRAVHRKKKGGLL